MNTGELYIVATPIGNLGDITHRAIETLEKADVVVCEDTRVTKRLLAHYKINTSMKTSILSLYGRGSASRKPALRINEIVGELKSGRNVAFVTDAGTPGISDPGNQLVESAVSEGISVIPVPGVSSLTTLASVAGIDLSRFVFLGFPPHKKGRETFFKEVAAFNFPVIYFESPHRLMKNLELLSVIASGAKQSQNKNEIAASSATPRNDKQIILGREMTKMFEEIVRGTVDETIEYFQKNSGKIKGEIVIIVY